MQKEKCITLAANKIIIFMILIFSYYSMAWTPNTVYYGSYVMNTLLAVIVIIGLGIVFKLFSGQFKKLSGWPGFFANLFFFIPFLLFAATMHLYYFLKCYLIAYFSFIDHFNLSSLFLSKLLHILLHQCYLSFLYFCLLTFIKNTILSFCSSLKSTSIY
jgi:hypothetical protein